MPLKLIPPEPGRSPNWRIRGTHLGTYVDRSSKTGERKIAQRELAKIKDEIKCGVYVAPGALTFAGAALSYMQGGGEKRFLPPLLRHFGDMPAAKIDQAVIDQAAVTLYPNATPQTRNRQVYALVSVILKRAGIMLAIRRPAGSQGSPRLHWLSPDQADAILTSALRLNPRFGALLVFLTYTGVRLSEALRLEASDLDLPNAYAYARKTKNGHPQPVHLPPYVVATLANIEFGAKRVFGFAKSGALYILFREAAEDAKVTIPPRIAFHIFRHTYGAWMRRYAGLDTAGLVGTGRWKSRTAAAIYEHVDAPAEARKADLLPTPTRAKTV